MTWKELENSIVPLMAIVFIAGFNYRGELSYVERV